jgi:DNA-binding CsgD family transcriptional regulator
MAGYVASSLSPIKLGVHTDFAQLIGAIGEDDFDVRLIALLNDICGAEHYSIFKLTRDDPAQFASVSLDGTDTARKQANIYFGRQCWRRDPTFLEARSRLGQAALTLLRLDVDNLDDRELRDVVYGRSHIRDRLLLSGEFAGTAFGLSILRSDRHERFSNVEIDRLRDLGEALLSIIAKHVGVRWQKSSFATALTSLEEIENSILAAKEHFPRREAEVCARILYGLTSVGIALDLGIGEETVVTYRKRAYQRLRVGCHRELLLWYLALWSSSPVPLTSMVPQNQRSVNRIANHVNHVS